MKQFDISVGNPINEFRKWAENPKWYFRWWTNFWL